MKIIGTNIYLTTSITAEDVTYLSTCWDEYRYVRHSDSSKESFLMGAVAKNTPFNAAPLVGRGKAFFAIKKKDTDELIGYTVLKYRDTTVDFYFTIFHPDYRESGYYSEMNILRHKFVYQDSFSINTTRIRKASSDTNTRQGGALINLYSRNEKEESIINKGTFTHSYITKDEWSAWINSTDQAAKRDAIFIVEED